ncbi:UDP-N-acetylglucosamine--N-acetylmuramyl-(pentapeptide) pyrophosphoryl-undecaprenol N-acetylglucosamine transferase [Anaerobaca lacustris]|uniref:UDP-N-acetylglucosamine--N-acetylmuramyl-(pentapeptide) pyrophosphoryl-undecaprenol N-acetylglucosamine transferase n=1 Tax=Anaerobaca lacustris TaxID=3044600 RepID=A0AAW6U299_9BACT|nr:UDP-N-acetylglucosamine--N-acetylmuramyl-(pentapeptide) pyrophosphoryl-undecaprenol N-acetylglucosamine transferase [Sedimentisphaerales bacterium M17dextr]
MSDISFFFAGGGTGGHIYPALAVAEQIVEHRPDARIHFLCSTRAVDARILDGTTFPYTALPATGLYFDPRRFVAFCRTFRQSYRLARHLIADSPRPVIIGAGGFVAAPVCMAGHRLGVPVVLVNVDLLPGRANRLSARWADEIFVQFEESTRTFGARRATVTAIGCPLRKGFAQPDRRRAIEALDLDADKKTLLITGASSGATRINEAICMLLAKLDAFAETWQIVHLTGLDHHEQVASRYEGVRIRHKVVSYYDQMPDLLATADLLVGRSGAVSVAEYAVAGAPSICMPYPHHKDRHQYRNAGKLVEVGAAVIVDDVSDPDDRADWLWEELQPLMADDAVRRQMADACKLIARPHAAADIAQRLIRLAERASGLGWERGA